VFISGVTQKYTVNMCIWPIDCLVSITVVKTLMYTKHVLTCFQCFVKSDFGKGNHAYLAVPYRLQAVISVTG